MGNSKVWHRLLARDSFFFLCPTLATIGITVFFILPAFRKTLSYQKGVRLGNQTETSMTLDGDHEKNYA